MRIVPKTLATLMTVVLLAAPSVFAQQAPQKPGCFTDHGIAAPVSENRGLTATRGADGQPVILALEASDKISLLAINAETGKSEQFWYPNRAEAGGGTYSRLLSSSGPYYVMFGSTFTAFDPATRKWTFAEDVKPNSLGMSYAEGPDGMIYFATYPRSELYQFDPAAREVTYLGQLDPDEKYPRYLAVDNEGWIYAGIGTVHSTLVAFNAETKERRLLHESTMRSVEGKGIGTMPKVYRGTDGEVYGEAWPGGPWLRLRGGEAARVDAPAEPTTAFRTDRWQDPLPHFPGGGGRVRNFSLSTRSFEFVQPDSSVEKVTFDYESAGANITRLVVGPDGNIYGGTSHPLQVFRYNPGADAITNFGGIDRVPSGNFPAYAVADGTIYGAAYVGGHLYAYDPQQPWTHAEGSNPNPRYLKSYPTHIGRPRVVRAQPDSQRVIIGGFTGYGDVGGGLAFYNYQTEQSTLLTGDQLLEGQSTITLRVLPGGDLVAGTSVRAPGGAQEVADEAALYLMDGATKEITFSTHPVEGARAVAAVALGPDGQRVYGLSEGGQLFAFDPETQQITRRKDLSPYGRAVRTDQSLRRRPDGSMYVLMTEGILRLDPGTFSVEPLATPPTEINAGIGLRGGRLYFASDRNVWSYQLGCE